MSLYQQSSPTVLACDEGGGGGGLLQSIAMAGSAAVITVTFIHPIDVIKVGVLFVRRQFHILRIFRTPSMDEYFLTESTFELVSCRKKKFLPYFCPCIKVVCRRFLCEN